MDHFCYFCLVLQVLAAPSFEAWLSVTTRQTKATQIKSQDWDFVNIEPGTVVERNFESVTFVIRVDPQFAQVDLVIKLHNRQMARATLTPSDRTEVFRLRYKDVVFRGSFTVRFAQPQQFSYLVGDFRVITPYQNVAFQGNIVEWQALNTLILERQIVWITPELRVETDLLLEPNQSVSIEFWTGTQLIHTVTLSQGANLAIVNKSFEIATVTIHRGLRLQLQPATPTQKGEVIMQGKFASSNLPNVTYKGAIATWSYQWFPQN